LLPHQTGRTFISHEAHVGEHPLSGSNITPEEFRKLVMDAIKNDEPLGIDGDNRYYRVYHDGKEYIIDVVVSSKDASSGMVVTAFEPDPLPTNLPFLII